MANARAEQQQAEQLFLTHVITIAGDNADCPQNTYKLRRTIQSETRRVPENGANHEVCATRL